MSKAQLREALRATSTSPAPSNGGSNEASTVEKMVANARTAMQVILNNDRMLHQAGMEPISDQLIQLAQDMNDAADGSFEVRYLRQKVATEDWTGPNPIDIDGVDMSAFNVAAEPHGFRYGDDQAYSFAIASAYAKAAGLSGPSLYRDDCPTLKITDHTQVILMGYAAQPVNVLRTKRGQDGIMVNVPETHKVFEDAKEEGGTPKFKRVRFQFSPELCSRQSTCLQNVAGTDVSVTIRVRPAVGLFTTPSGQRILFVYVEDMWRSDEDGATHPLFPSEQETNRCKVQAKMAVQRLINGKMQSVEVTPDGNIRTGRDGQPILKQRPNRILALAKKSV